MGYGGFKDLQRITVPVKVLHNNVFANANNPKQDGYHRGIASIAYKLFDKKTGDIHPT